MKKSIKLSNWAKLNGYSYRGAYELYKRGGIPSAYTLSTGTIMIPDEEPTITICANDTIIYARVSTHGQKKDLDRQVSFITEYCAANGWKIDKIYKEIASGLNDNRSQLNKLFELTNVKRVVISEKDRLTRFGFNYIKKLFDMKGIELIVINQASHDEHDLMQDFISIITSMAARVYGLRRHKSHISKILEDLHG